MSKPKQSSNKSEAKLLSLIKAEMLQLMKHLRVGLVLEILRKRGVSPEEIGYLWLRDYNYGLKYPKSSLESYLNIQLSTDLGKMFTITYLADNDA